MNRLSISSDYNYCFDVPISLSLVRILDLVLLICLETKEALQVSLLTLQMSFSLNVSFPSSVLVLIVDGV